tara:strand:+ start:421 stop:1071 length:651 start_codon:yes stop_codon:yes gene_type:complete
MARKKGIVKQISNYGEKHPYVTLALAGTFGYYFYENMVKPRMADEGPDMRYAVQGIGMTTSTSTTTSSSHIPSMRGEGAGEPSMDIDPTKSGLFGMKNPPAHLMNRQVESNPPAHLMYEKAQGIGNLGSHCNGLGSHCNARGNPHCHCGGGMAGFSPSARRRIGHSGLGMASESYEAELDTQFSNQEAMVMGDLKKHEDILGFSGMMPLQGGDWHE